MTATTPQEAAPLPPRPLVKLFWKAHRAMYRITGGRFGLQRPETGAKFGMLRIRTVGRRSGKTRETMLGYYPDGDSLVTLAMNGWGTADPAWWLNLQANPIATVDLADGSRSVRARAAEGAERERLWATFRDYPGWGTDIAALAATRPNQTAVVVLEPEKEPIR
jgi:deazaflavin-dependent oxidoreductase (nitroreductase family)